MAFRKRFGIERARLETPAGDVRNMLIVDDHALIRHALAMSIGARFPDIQVHEAGSLREALQHVPRLQPLAAVLYDLGLADADGLPGLARLLDAVDGVPVIVISASVEPAIGAECIRAGARGFVPKWCSAATLEHALPLVMGGGIYAPGAAPADVAGPAPRRSGPPHEAQMRDPLAQSLLERLTGRQREVLSQLIAGKSNKEIARELGVLEGTVKVHVRAIMRELKVRNRTQVAMASARAGYFG